METPTTPSSMEVDDDDDERAAFCSILNVVIDFNMEDATSMEPDEYQNGQGQQQVPVIRIFGPLLRKHSVNPPLQSACLHIHGAFPYLIARPRVAGPDGSMKLASRVDSGSVDWDSRQAVERIADSIQETLESTLQSFDLQNQNNSVEENSNTTSTKNKFIKNITIMEGRGFYTYCNGPPAPFLRVEYFDPKLRWKVKMLLERGLEVPRSYHPDPKQYDRDDPDEDLLKFHCYEAHIPYTMQFFKDWNLAGMSYIHLNNVKLRGGLGKHNRDYYVKKAENSSIHFNENDIFLSSNTPKSCLWESEYSRDNNTDALKKRTHKKSSCDIEMDVHVENIMNVQSVMKTMPEDQGEKDEIHWRAVPSLQDIWKEERIRMRQLLGPQHDLVSKPLSFTLNVKKDAARPGARPALKGMRKLVQVTYGLKEDFNKSLSDILNRHHNAIQENDKQIALKREQEDNNEEDSALTPTLNEALDALESMGNVEAVSVGTPKYKISTGTPSSDDWLLSTRQSGSLSQTFEHSQNSSRSSAVKLSHNRHQLLSYSCSQDMHEHEVLSTQQMDPALYSQRIERGDAVIDGFDDAIDPETLLPYPKLAFRKDTCRAIFVVETDPPGTKRVCGCNSLCSRPGHQLSMNRAKPRYYKTVNTGANVDGIINGSNIDSNDYQNYYSQDGELVDEGLSQDELSEDEEDLMRDLLATQIPDDNMVSARRTVDLDNYGISMTQQLLQLGQASVTQASSKHTSSFLENSDDEESIHNEDMDSGYQLTRNDMQATLMLSSNEAVEPLSLDSKPSSDQDDQLLAPPTRDQLKRGDGSQDYLKPLSTKNCLPPWLGHATKYTPSRGEGNDAQFGASAALASRGHHVQPVYMPPTRGKVAAWYKKRGKPITTKNEVPVAKREKIDVNLEIDSNSRKLVPVIRQPSPSDGGEKKMSRQQNVEEVEWAPSQLWQLTPTQPSQNSFDERKICKSSSKPGPSNIQTVCSPANDSVTNSCSVQTESIQNIESQNSDHALDGIGNQGGRIHIQGGGGLKTRTNISQAIESKSDARAKASGKYNSFGFPSPVSIMSIEIHVQCRTGYSRLDAETKLPKKIALTTNPRKREDKVSAIVYVHGRDPGGGKSMEILSRGCLFVPLRARPDDTDLKLQKSRISSSMPGASMEMTSPLSVECFKDEKSLLRRFAGIVTGKDPDMILSWDTQGSGIGYLIERGVHGAEVLSEGGSRYETVDMARLLGRTPRDQTRASFFKKKKETDEGKGNEEAVHNEETAWRGSGLGSDWDEKVGAGAAAASIVGRLAFAAWKIIAEEVKHANASYLPAVVSAVMSKRIPHHDELTLTHWYASGNERWRVLNHRLTQATSYLLLFDALDIIGRAGEAARLSGVEFSQSFPGIRGSQYKVEGVLLRALQSLRSDERGSKRGKARKGEELTEKAFGGSTRCSNDTRSPTQEPWKFRREGKATLENRHYFFFSSSSEDANKQEALEVQALTLEPQSGHYTDPVVVCDFTALYPSLVIAYNLCYSTCAGKLEYHSTRREMHLEGRMSGHVGPFLYPERRTATILADHMQSLKDFTEEDANTDRAYVAPTGTVYVSENVLKGILPLVLEEILTTRAMLKKAAKEYKKNVKNLSPAILRQLEARQLALKYVANVTYGYTSATFSGRSAMPLLADTIVECGRKTLRRAIDLANKWGKETERWKGCRTIYGDTDSLFVVLPGRSYKEAFDFGEELCEAVRKDNPPPVELKLEKVYAGSIMQTMKKYCGMKYESKTQKKPSFEAKGLETVRRDQCSLTQKVLRNALITLFKSGTDAVKEYLFRQWSLIYAGNLPVSDFVLTGRVRSRYRGGREGPVQAVLANRIRIADPDFQVRHKERLPYVIMDRGRKCSLKDSVLTPLELLEHWNTFKIHTGYYIEKHVNASLQRCLGLAPHRIDVDAWFRECPRRRRRTHFWPVRSNMITEWFGSGVCTFCERSCHANGRSRVGVCNVCRQDPVRTTQMALPMLQQAEQAAHSIAKECQKCSRCFESADTFASVRVNEDSNKPSLVFPLANCVCIDCPNTYKRHRLRELMIEASNTCEVLGLNNS